MVMGINALCNLFMAILRQRVPRLIFAAPLATPRRGVAALGENFRSARQVIEGHPCPLKFSTCCSKQASSPAISKGDIYLQNQRIYFGLRNE
jgi:hypothetical protein